MVLFVVCLLANLGWMALEGHRGFLPWMAFNGVLLVVLVAGQALLLLGCLAGGIAAERAGRLRLALAAYRWGGRLAAPHAFGFRVNEMALRVRLEDFAGADALWAQVEPELGRPETCAAYAVGIRAAALVNRGRLQEAVAVSAETDDAEKVRRRGDYPVVDALRLGNRASALMGLGRFEEAQDALTRSRERAGPHPQVGAVLRMNAAWLALYQGRPDEALAAAREGAAGARPEPGWVLLLARLGERELPPRPWGGLVAAPGTVRERYMDEVIAGFAAWNAGDPAEARRRFEAAAALSTPPGEELLEAGRRVGSEACFQALRERSPESVWARRALDQGAALGAEGILAP